MVMQVPIDAEIVDEPAIRRILMTYKAGSVAILVVAILIIAAFQSIVVSPKSGSSSGEDSRNVAAVWDQSVYLPRHEECIDESNGQDLPEFGIGYEPSISITSNGNMFITAHKDLRLSLIHI